MKDEETKRLMVLIGRDNDQDAFRLFFDHFYPRLLKFALYFLESNQAAEEIVSTVFIGVWNNRQKLPKIERIEAYLFSSVRNKSFSYLRDNKRIQMKDLGSEESLFVPCFDSPDAELLNNELKDIIFEAINKLPPRCKMIFLLIREDGFKYNEVAELLDISPKTVEAQMGRALDKLRENLSPYLKEMGILQIKNSKSILTFLSLIY
ncbi:MAG: RNA polymerase sigma-70 factor [Cyclobacteriaceae bacterium]|nr:RNA polymerase sigma-70 factor [Cyclobacteriaceae bacterium]